MAIKGEGRLADAQAIARAKADELQKANALVGELKGPYDAAVKAVADLKAEYRQARGDVDAALDEYCHGERVSLGQGKMIY